jgi:hypothetical protein
MRSKAAFDLRRSIDDGPDFTQGARQNGTVQRRIGLLLVGAISVFLFIASPAYAVSDSQELGRFGSEGSAQGQMAVPFGVATDPSTGTVYVADLENNRIDVYTPWGEFQRAWGWGVKDGNAELEVCTDSCRAGIAGAGPGQLDAPLAVAVDSAGFVYVREGSTNRVQKFSGVGEFDLMFGGGVNQTNGEDICTAASHDVCGAGVGGSGQGEFLPGASLAIGSGNTIAVGDLERIQEFEPSGQIKRQVHVAGGFVRSVAVDSADGFYYLTFEGQENVDKFDSSGALMATLPVVAPKQGIALGSEGEVFVVSSEAEPGQLPPGQVLEFSPGDGTAASAFATAEPVPGIANRTFELYGLATNTAGDVYVINNFSASGHGSFIRFFGPPPLRYGPPPKAAPTITTQSVVASGPNSASVKAQINPHFWNGTSYYVEYGLGKCSEGGCELTQPAALGGGAVNKAVNTDPVSLGGLSPSTIYHYRFVTTTVFGSGEEAVVRGVNGEVGNDGAEGTFSTFGPVPPPDTNCPNQAFRTEASALLPDCRAYEMVSPVEKENGEILSPVDVTGFETRLDQSATSGEALAFSTYRSFGGSGGAPYTSQYIASRGPEGWSTQALGEPRGPSFYAITFAAENEFKGFTADLCSSWQVRDVEPQLAVGGIAGFPNLYRRENCGGTAYEALTTVRPPNADPSQYLPELQGFAANGQKAIFRVNDKLTTNATAGKYQLYEASEGALSLVCILPNETAYGGNCSAGTAPSGSQTSFNRTGSVGHALSEGGSRIYWSASAEAGEPGKIYLRLNGNETVKVSETQSTLKSQFWAAAADGSGALFTVTEGAKSGNLYRYSLEEGASSLLAGQVIGVVGASEDLSRVYFVSKEAIGGSGTAGEPNLYLEHDGAKTFIATLSADDVRLGSGAARLPSDATSEPVYHSAHVSPDGRYLAFISVKPLTGFDNTDGASGMPDSEVFIYAADSATLDCASCSPVGVSPLGRNVQAQANEGFLPTAASITPFETQLYQSRALSNDGDRLFFTSYADLLPQDINGKADVYEWERVGSDESCQNTSDPSYYPGNGGCLFLISTGSAPTDSEFVEADPSGGNVFFATRQSLLPQDPGLIDIYDARVGGGFRAAESAAALCEGEACQTLGATPATAPVRSNVAGPGNQKAGKCPKGTHRVTKKGKDRCVKKKAGKKSKTKMKHRKKPAHRTGVRKKKTTHGSGRAGR